MIEKVQLNLEEETEVLLNRISDGLEDRISAEPEWAKSLKAILESLEKLIRAAKDDHKKSAEDASAGFAAIERAIANFREKYNADHSVTRKELAEIQKFLEQIKADQKIHQKHLDYLVLPWWKKIIGGYNK